MEWHHRNRIKASMAYIENMVNEIDDCLKGKDAIYKNVKIDLDEKQIAKVKESLRRMNKALKEAKQVFNLEGNMYDLSHIIEVDCSYMLETIDDLWSKKLEKSSGKIESDEKKKHLDTILSKIKEESDILMEVARTKARRQNR